MAHIRDRFRYVSDCFTLEQLRDTADLLLGRIAEMEREPCTPEMEPFKRAAIAELTRDIERLKGEA